MNGKVIPATGESLRRKVLDNIFNVTNAKFQEPLLLTVAIASRNGSAYFDEVGNARDTKVAPDHS